MTTRWVPRGPVCVTGSQLAFLTKEIDDVGRGVSSGRSSAIALSPDSRTIYAGAASGGVWRSDDDGAHWQPLMDREASLSVGAITVAHDGTVYVGTGELNDTNSGSGMMTGVGILRSIDRGTTWSLLPAPDPAGDDLLRSRIARIVVHPQRPNELYAATSKGLFIATDRAAPGIATHHVFALGSATKPECTDVAVDFTDPDAPIVYAAFIDAGIVKTVGSPLDAARPIADRFVFGAAMPMTLFPGVDIGAVWRIGLALAESRPATLYAAFSDSDGGLNGLFRTDDHGQAWHDAGTATFGEETTCEFTLLLAVDPRDPETVFFGDTRLWRRTATQGWHIVSAHRGDYPGVHDDQHAMVFDRNDPRVVWLGNDGGIWKSTDGGEHFYARNRGLATAQLYALSQFPGEPTVLLGGTQDLGGIVTRGHPAWHELLGGDGFCTAIEPASPRYWYIGYNPATDAVVRYSEADDGHKWKVVTRGLPDSPINATPYSFVADPNVAGRLYLGIDTLRWAPDNHADSWEDLEITEDPATGGTIWAIGVAPSDSNIVYYARTTGEVYRLERTGNTWGTPVKASRRLPTEGDDRCQALAVDPHHPERIFVVIGNTDGPDSDDAAIAHRIWSGVFSGGVLTVKPFDDLPEVTIGAVTTPAALNHVNAIVLDPVIADVMYVGTDLGVYRWALDPADATWKWSRFSDGLPSAAVVTAMNLSGASRRLRVATMGRGVWECALDAPDRAIDLYVRDCGLDDGTTPTVEVRQNPLSLGLLHWNEGADIKVDTERRLLGGFASTSTVGYDGSGGVDYLGFEALGSDNPRGGAASRVYVQVHNRGPEVAAGVRVRVFYALKSGAGYPDVPAGFWDHHLDDTFDATHWKPLGPAQTLAELVPASPEVVRFDWTASGSNDTIGLLAVVSSADDPLPALPLAVEAAVRADKHLALRECNVDPATYKIVLEVAAIIGLVVLAVVEGPKLV